MSAELGQELTPRSARARCAVCHDDLPEPVVSARWTCAHCGTLTHHDCANELERCPTLACAGEVPGGGERELRYHEQLTQRDGWILRWVPGLGALFGGSLGAIEAWSASSFGLQGAFAVIAGAVVCAVMACVAFTAVAFVAWELWRKLRGVPEPWD